MFGIIWSLEKPSLSSHALVLFPHKLIFNNKYGLLLKGNEELFSLMESIV